MVNVRGMEEKDSDFSPADAAQTLWGKSTDHGAIRPHLLLQHLYDTLAVGELIWDEYLGDPVRHALDAATADRGREFFAFLCGIHDVGKATPKFQSKSAELAARVQATGLTWRGVIPAGSEWHHTVAGACIVRAECAGAGWSPQSVAWVWPMVGGHHGRIPSVGMTRRPPTPDYHGVGPAWRAVQRWVLEDVARAAGFGALADAAPVGSTPPPGVQLAISGAIIMADWLASAVGQFEPIADTRLLGVDRARERARAGWDAFDLRSGITRHAVPGDVMRARFDRGARPLQELVIREARATPSAGLMLIEAPMGEGKTEAALAAAEILADRFGLRGIFVGMPTQATSDPMFHRVHGWSKRVAPDAPIMLLHGKAMFNPEFVAMQEAQPIGPLYEDTGAYGDTGDEYGIAERERVSAPVVDWFRGRKRGLLAPLGIGTIDNLLHAATRTSHVMLRYAGLAQKVVILDEVHAATVYMSQFLKEALRWLASTGVPVVVLTATLPPAMRHELVAAYAAGAGVADVPELDVAGYPSVTTVAVADGAALVHSAATEPWRADARVAVDELLDDLPAMEEAAARALDFELPRSSFDDTDAVVALLQKLLADGGTALVIRNTVRRAQDLFVALDRVFPGDVGLLHARLTVGDRAKRTRHELDLLGPSGSGRRARHILVATQIAEQSFDVDADVLITDLAPIDLLIQRVGRIHRHARGERPAQVSEPRVVVTGVRWAGDVPDFPYAAKKIYGLWSLLRAADLVRAARGTGWVLPADISPLVRAGYRAEPTAAEVRWPERMAAAAAERRISADDRIGDASQFLLSVSREGPLPEDLGGLHSRLTSARDDEALDAVVRDGELSPEVVLVRRGNDGAELTLTGRMLSNGGVLTAGDDIAREAMESIVRLPAGQLRGGMTMSEAVRAIPTPAAWLDHSYLRFMKPLVLDGDGIAEIGGRTFRYDTRLGLVEERR